MSKKRILCIDDSYTALLLLEHALSVEGYNALTALNVEEAIKIVKDKAPDLILLDLSMPEISGYDFLKMRNQLQIENVPILVVSAFDSNESKEEAQSLGAVEFISKPILLKDILQRIKALLNT
jgi:DNA-binding response OmpR family regulator